MWGYLFILATQTLTIPATAVTMRTSALTCIRSKAAPSYHNQPGRVREATKLLLGSKEPSILPVANPPYRRCGKRKLRNAVVLVRPSTWRPPAPLLVRQSATGRWPICERGQRCQPSVRASPSRRTARATTTKVCCWAGSAARTRPTQQVYGVRASSPLC